MTGWTPEQASGEQQTTSFQSDPQATPDARQCQCGADVSHAPSFSPGIEGRSYHVALTHPQFGTLAVSQQKFDQMDADRILSEARAALVVPQVGQVAFGPV